MRNYVIINGVNSLTIQGLAIKTLPPITKPIQRNLREEIDGRDGDIVTTLGYGAYDKTIEIGLFGTFDIDEVIAYFNQKGTITFSNEADKVYYFEALDQVDYAELLKFRTANVVLHCQPFKYPLNETPLVEEYEYVNGSGTNLTLNNTAEAIFNKIELQGNTSQATTILPSEYTQVEYIQSNGNQYIDTGLLGGQGKTLKIRLMPLDTTDRFVYGSRQSTGNTAVYLSNRMLNNAWQISYGNYFYSAEDTYEANTIVDIEVSMSNGSQTIKKNGTQIYSSTYSVSFETFTQNDYLFSFNNQGTAGNKASMRLYDCQVLEGTTLKRHFIPCYRNSDSVIGLYDLITKAFFTNAGSGNFTKGNDAVLPNPNYPQPVQVVSGDNEISICGKNLFDINWLNGTDITIENAVATGTATILYNTFERNGNYIPNTEYGNNQISISASAYTDGNASTSGNGIYIQVNYTDNTYERIGFSNANTTKTTKTLTTNVNKTIKNIALGYSSSGSNIWHISEIMITYGDTPQNYEPYNGETYPLYLGVENLLSIPNGTYSNHSVSAVVEDGVITLNGTATGGTSYININLGENISMNGEYYTYSISNTATSTIEVRLFDTNNNYMALGTTIIDNKTTRNDSRTFNLLSIVTTNGVTLNNFIIKPQLEKGEKSNKFTPYGTTPIEMASIPNTTCKDLFVKENGTWYKRENVGKVIIDGSQSVNAPTGMFPLYFLYTNQWANFIYANGGWCSSFKYIQSENVTANSSANQVLNDNEMALRMGNNDRDRLYFKASQFANNTEANTYFRNNPTPFYFAKVEYTDIELNDTLQEQLEDIWNATSYRGQTNITQTSNDLPFMMEVSALKLGSDHLEVENTGNIYSKPTIELEGTGIVDIYLNDVQVFEVDLSEENKITIDTEKMEAYTDTGLANRKVTGDYSTFKLNVGTNDLRFSGALTSATITRYLRWL